MNIIVRKITLFHAPVTITIIVICIIMMCSTIIIGGYTTENLEFLGAYAPSLVAHGDYWRAFTYSFSHLGYTHLLLNTILLIFMAPPAERMLGTFKFILLFFGTTLSAAFVIHFFSNFDYTVGISGFIYGLFGMYCYLAIKYNNDTLKFLIPFLILGMITTIWVQFISTACHVGGFLGGLLISFFIFYKDDSAYRQENHSS